MKVEKSLTIENNVVLCIGTQGNLTYYMTDFSSEDETLYITNPEEEVIGKLTISADCDQNRGFISEIVCANFVNWN